MNDALSSETGGRSLLVRRLVNFLKEYHLSGEDDVIRDLLRDIATDGCKPLNVGAWGQVRSTEVREALACHLRLLEGGRPALVASNLQV